MKTWLKQHNIHKIITIGLMVCGIVLVSAFGLRAFRDYRRFHGGRGPIETDVTRIRGWMTIPYISHAYHVPEPVLFRALHIPPQPENRDYALGKLAKEHDREPEEVIQVVQQAILTFQKQHPPPPPPPAPPPTPPPPPATEEPSP